MPAGDIDTLIQLFARLPGLGPRSARRLVLQLLRRKDVLMHPLIDALQKTSASVRTCTSCGNLDVTDPCTICLSEKRDRSVLCVVEDLADLWAIERSGMFKGLYHVMGGTLSALDGRGPEDINLPTLLARARTDEISEVILAMNATVEGQATAHYINDLLIGTQVKISRLAQGIPMGGELDYLDDGTLGAALKARLAV